MWRRTPNSLALDLRLRTPDKTYRPSNDDVPQAHVVLRGGNRHALDRVGGNKRQREWNGRRLSERAGERESRRTEEHGESGEELGEGGVATDLDGILVQVGQFLCA
jgi:hypothetical protein